MTPAQEAQALFEALFDHIPLVDLRTPADIAAGVQLHQQQDREPVTS